MTHLKVEVLAALRRAATLDDLLEIVSRYKSEGASQRTTYDTLEAIWIELGCSGTDEESPVCELLADVMDCVWGYCSAKDALWDTSLSDE